MYVSLSNQILRKRLKNKIPISLPNYINCTVVIRKTLESQIIAKKKNTHKTSLLVTKNLKEETKFCFGIHIKDIMMTRFFSKVISYLK